MKQVFVCEECLSVTELEISHHKTCICGTSAGHIKPNTLAVVTTGHAIYVQIEPEKLAKTVQILVKSLIFDKNSSKFAKMR